MSRCIRGSHNYELQKKKVARCHEKIRNQRRDHLHKLSRKIADGYDAAAVEDIDMKAMGQCLHFGKKEADSINCPYPDKLIILWPEGRPSVVYYIKGSDKQSSC